MRAQPIIHRLEELIDSPSVEFGTIVAMSYDEAIVATTDGQVRAAGGVPQRCFLLAVPTPENDDEPVEELVLLSVQTIVPLETTRSYTALREELALAGTHSPDFRTRKGLEQLAFSCSIVGTFYRTEDNTYRFGGDVDRVRAHSLFKVYRPRGRALSLIGSYGHGVESRHANAALDLGVVRYSETQRVPDPDARVFVSIADFVGKKSAVLGVSRSGKSNTMKIVCQKTFEYGKLTGQRLGQIIFDPQGEYANATKQDVALEDDPSALANIGSDEEVRIYKVLKDSENETGKLRHLQLNLMDEDNVEFLWSMMLRNLASGASAGTNYISSLENQRFYRPGRGSSQDKKDLWARQLLGVYGLVGAALPETHALKKPLHIFLPEHAADVESLIDHLTFGRTPDHILVENTDDALALLEYLIDNEARLGKELRAELKRGVLAPFKEQILAQREGRNGVVAAFRRTMPFHNARAVGDVREKIWDDMVHGRLVMVDLSKGSPKTVQALSDLIATYLIDQSAANFTAGRDNVNYQVVVEEAHNLFGDASTEAFTPWVRISKEGAKYGIGLVYATQEVTGVDHRILSNTSNFIVSHLSSTTETKQLGRYYGFDEWASHLMRVETKGFVRMKTESSPYIVPVQIDKFDADSTSRHLGRSDTKPSETAQENPVSSDMPAGYTDEEIESLF